MRTTQDRTIERLETEVLRAIDKIVDDGSRAIQVVWEEAKGSIRNVIADEYRRNFPRGTWSMVNDPRVTMNVISSINRRVAGILESFHQASLILASTSFREVYYQGVLRNAWLIDQVTPPSMDVKLPKSPLFREADPVYRGPESDTAWKVRWSAWMDAYRNALDQNLRLGAMNNSEPADAIAEVDATRPGSPQMDMWDAIERVYGNQSEVVYSSAQHDVADANPEFDIVEIWQTRYYDRVCDFCDDQRGLTIDEAESDIPAHPNCGCYWRLVPASWAKLLRAGNMDERAMAQAMDASGEVPNAMLIFNDDGKLVGSTIVEYEAWSDDRMSPIRSR